MARQELITRDDSPLQLVAILDEAVLRRQVGGRETMREQLHRLIDLGARDNVEILVVPFSAGAHAAMDGPFHLLEFPDADDPDLVYLEQAGSGLVPEDVKEIRCYTLIFGNLIGKALPAAQSLAFLEATLREL